MIHPLIKAKSKRVGEWAHPTSGIVTEYFLEDTKFVCVVLEERLSAPEASVLRAKVEDKLDHWLTMEWFPVMEIEVEDKSPGSYRDEPKGDGLAIGVRRYFLSRSPAGKVYQCDWDVDEIHRKAKMTGYGNGYNRYGNNDTMALTRLPLAAPLKLGEEKTMIDYTEEAWAGCQEIIKGLGIMRARLSKLIRSREGLRRLTSGGAKLLTEGNQ
jgi:hypothetical protein